MASMPIETMKSWLDSATMNLVIKGFTLIILPWLLHDLNAIVEDIQSLRVSSAILQTNAALSEQRLKAAEVDGAAEKTDMRTVQEMLTKHEVQIQQLREASSIGGVRR